MKTSYYLVAAAGLTAAAMTIYHRLPARADTPPAMLPLPHEPVGLAAATVPVLPAVPDIPLPPIVPAPDHDVALPEFGKPAPLPLLPTTPTSVALPPTPALPASPSTPSLPSTPAATPALPGVPPVTTPSPATLEQAVPTPKFPVVPPVETRPSPVPAPAPAATPPAATPALPGIPPVATPSPATLDQAVPTPKFPVVPPVETRPSPVPAPAPVKPGAPEEPKPLPLPAPTPFTPGLDKLQPEPAANLAPAGKFVVLKGNRLVEGTAKIQGDKIIVRQGALDRSFARADVLCLADSRDAVYQFMLSKAGDNVESRLAVAKWCTLNGLREQALGEAREILRLQPTNRGAADLARSLETSLRQFPADGSRPRPDGALLTVDEPAADVSAEAATSFATRAQPILANQCIECHARDDHASAFKLKRVTGFEVGPHSTHANLRAVAAQLKKDDPASSPLLVKALTAHGGMKQPAFVSRKAVAYRTLESWVATAVSSGSVPPMIPPTPPVSPEASGAPAVPGWSASTSPEVAPITAENPAAVPPVLPTPPSIPAADPATRTAPPSAPIPLIPSIDASAPAALPTIPGLPQSRSQPKAPETVKSTAQTVSQFGTGSKPVAPGGADEFDPAAFNRTVQQTAPMK